jgi:hypothetical protein
MAMVRPIKMSFEAPQQNGKMTLYYVVLDWSTYNPQTGHIDAKFHPHPGGESQKDR